MSSVWMPSVWMSSVWTVSASVSPVVSVTAVSLSTSVRVALSHAAVRTSTEQMMKNRNPLMISSLVVVERLRQERL